VLFIKILSEKIEGVQFVPWVHRLLRLFWRWWLNIWWRFNPLSLYIDFILRHAEHASQRTIISRCNLAEAFKLLTARTQQEHFVTTPKVAQMLINEHVPIDSQVHGLVQFSVYGLVVGLKGNIDGLNVVLVKVLTVVEAECEADAIKAHCIFTNQKIDSFPLDADSRFRIHVFLVFRELMLESNVVTHPDDQHTREIFCLRINHFF
jgi:hypothetical protein